MSHRLACTALLAAAAAVAQPVTAAEKQFVLKDQSNPALIDSKAALTILEEAIPNTRMHKVYNNLRWGFASQVEGGVTPGGVCVVTARVMLLPATVGKSLVFNPRTKVTVFDAVPVTARDKCAEVATAKLKEAATALVSSLLK
jgi:hypothetical protein